MPYRNILQNFLNTFPHKLRSYYERSPYCVRLAAGMIGRRMPARFRYGSAFIRYQRLLDKSQYWSEEELINYQNDRLRYVIDHAYSHVPYYRRLFDQLRLKPEDIRDMSHLKYLPFLTRDDVRENLEDLQAGDIAPSHRKYVTTGGTSGKPLGFYIDKDSSVIDWAFMVAQWKRVGFQLDDKRAVLRGRVVENSDQERLWEYDPIHNELIFSSYHLSDESLGTYLEVMGRYRPRFLHSYPSTAMILANYLRQSKNPAPPSLQALLISSENMLDSQRAFLEQTFGCRAYSWYGHGEKCILAGECEFSTQYHIFPEYGIVEIVDNEGEPITTPGVPGVLVGTGLISSSMPFIRYLTDDMAQWASDVPCECGRSYPRIENVHGRWNQEVLVARSGALISMAALNLHSAVYVKIKQFQFYQETPGEAILRVVRAPGYTEDTDREILDEFNRKLGHSIQLQIAYVSSIEQTMRGKYKFIDQKLEVQTPMMMGSKSTQSN